MTRLQWQPLFAGLVRLWHGEVLDKFPVAQHILFGEIFSASWRTADVIAAEVCEGVISEEIAIVRRQLKAACSCA